MCSSPIQYFRMLKKIHRGWTNVNQRNFNRSIKGLCRARLLQERKLSDGSFRLELTEEGKRQARLRDIFGSSLRFKIPKRWDKRWRIVIFDVPEKDRHFRNILRSHLDMLRFHKLQQSVFISPYPFEKELLKLVDLYNADSYVRVITATAIDNDKKLKDKFFKTAPSSKSIKK